LPVCKGGNATLKSKDCTFPSEIKWSVSSNLAITYEDGFAVEVKAIASGEATITATFENGQTYTETFWVGEPELDPLVACDNRDDCWSLCASYNLGLENSITIKR